MKSKEMHLPQYGFETKNLEDDNLEFITASAPLIGFVVVYFNTLEEDLTSFICNLISDRADAKGLIFTYKMSYSAKVDLLNRYISIMTKYSDQEISHHEEIFKKLNECGQLRNKVIHADWETSDLEGFTFVKIKINSNGILQEYVQFSVESLQEIIKLIISTTDLLYEYKEAYFTNLYK